MRALTTLWQLVSRVRVVASPTAPPSRPLTRGQRPRVTPPPSPPVLASRGPTFVQIERDVIARFRPQIRQAIEDALHAVGDHCDQHRPVCCGRPMRRHDRRRVGWLTWVGRISIPVWRYRCARCRAERRPLPEALDIEPGQPSGLLARVLGLVGCVAPYSLAAQLVSQLLDVSVNAMTVWRAVQRLGEAAARYTEALDAYHADSRSVAPPASQATDTVVVAVDGCMLGMQVRTTRRRRPTPDTVLPSLPPVEDGHFREVKTAVLLQPSERVQVSPERRTLVRRLVVTCLGDADALFARLWAHLRAAGWLGAHTLVVIVGDGSEWIWHRATQFVHRCEILDFWHAMGYAWAYAQLQFGEGSSRANAWTHRIAQDLKAGRVHIVLGRLRTLHPISPESRAALDALIKYYTDNATRMCYDEYLRLGYGIGSGAVESAHKQVVHARLRQAGMRWSAAGARRLLALRLLLLNGDWAQTDRLRLLRV